MMKHEVDGYDDDDGQDVDDDGEDDNSNVPAKLGQNVGRGRHTQRCSSGPVRQTP